MRNGSKEHAYGHVKQLSSESQHCTGGSHCDRPNGQRVFQGSSKTSTERRAVEDEIFLVKAGNHRPIIGGQKLYASGGVTAEMITVEDLEDVSDTDSSFENSPAPLSKAANHRAFQNLIDENESLKRESKRKKEKLESAKNRLQELQSELDASRGKSADVDLYSKKLEIALSENLKLKSKTPATDDNNAYSEMETAFLTRKYQESKVVEAALKNQIALSADVKDQDDRTIETLTRRVKQLDKELRGKDDRVARMELELAEVTEIVSGFEEFVDANVYRQVVEKAKGKSPLNGEQRKKSGKRIEDDAEVAPSKTASKVCTIL